MTEPRWDLIERTRKEIAQDPEVYAGDPVRLRVTADRILELLGGSDEDGDPVRPL